MTEAIIYGIIAGVLGTALGGIIGVFFTKRHLAFSGLLFFAGGFMMSVVAFELVPEALQHAGVLPVSLGLVGGVAFVAMFSDWVEKHSSLQRVAQKDKKHFISGLTIFMAISLHNFPEGIAVGSGTVTEIGITVALMIAIHNIPEGASMALPLKESGMNSWKVVGLCALSGLPTAFGAIFGNIIGGVSDLLVAVCMAVAGGAMVHITIEEIFPSAVKERTNKWSPIMGSVGFVLGLIMVEVL